MSASEPTISVSVEESGLGPRPNSTRASIGGVGGGTGMVALAQAIGPKTAAGVIILYLAPAVSVFVGIILYYFEAQTSRYLERRALNNAMNNTRKALEQQLDSPRLTAASKNKIRKMLEDLEESFAKSQVEQVKLISIRRRSSTQVSGS